MKAVEGRQVEINNISITNLTGPKFIQASAFINADQEVSRPT